MAEITLGELVFGPDYDMRHTGVMCNAEEATQEQAQAALDAITHSELRACIDTLEAQVRDRRPVAIYAQHHRRGYPGLGGEWEQDLVFNLQVLREHPGLLTAFEETFVAAHPEYRFVEINYTDFEVRFDRAA